MRHGNTINLQQIFFLLLFMVGTQGGNFLYAEQSSSVFDLLSTAPHLGIQEARPVTLHLPLDSIYAKTKNEQAAVISFTDDTGREFRRPLHVEVRGKFRRRLCTFPPIKLNFSKKQLKADGLSKHDKLKLVTPCLEGDEDAQALILKEYLAYKLYEQLSPRAFRTQLLEITYRDINGNHSSKTVFAFVLEDTDELAERLGGKELEDELGLSPERFDQETATTQALFSYFIGNLDWNLSLVRNIKLIQQADGTVIPVPYDFDFSGFVAAPYARLNADLGQQYFGQRIYLGYQVENQLLDATYLLFESKRKELLKTVRGFTLLNINHRISAADYLVSFYTDAKRIRRQYNSEKVATSLYHLIRAEQLNIVPAGGKAQYYGLSR